MEELKLPNSNKEKVELPLICDLCFKSEDGKVYVRNVYDDDSVNETNEEWREVMGARPDSNDDYEQLKEELIEGYKKRGLWKLE